jgi:hypothetical protein
MEVTGADDIDGQPVRESFREKASQTPYNGKTSNYNWAAVC